MPTSRGGGYTLGNCVPVGESRDPWPRLSALDPSINPSEV